MLNELYTLYEYSIIIIIYYVSGPTLQNQYFPRVYYKDSWLSDIIT